MPEEILKNEKTHLRCKVIIEMLGKPKQHVEKTLRTYVDKIKNDSELIVLDVEYMDAEEKENLWSTFAEIEMVIRGIPKLIAFCFDYMPSSVQILKPEEFAVSNSTVEDFINDLQARLHDVDMIVKKLKNENEFLKKNMHKSIKNLILIALASGNLDKDELSKITGINGKELEAFLDLLSKENRIAKEDGIYSLTNRNSENVEE